MACNETLIIRLEGLNFFSSIGVGKQELMVGNEFLVDCELELPAEGFMSEILESTVSYADVYALIESIMRRKWLLLESVAKAIGDECKAKWPGISRISVKVKKVSPPIRGIQGSCSVEYRKNE